MDPQSATSCLESATPQIDPESTHIGPTRPSESNPTRARTDPEAILYTLGSGPIFGVFSMVSTSARSDISGLLKHYSWGGHS